MEMQINNEKKHSAFAIFSHFTLLNKLGEYKEKKFFTPWKHFGIALKVQIYGLLLWKTTPRIWSGEVFVPKMMPKHFRASLCKRIFIVFFRASFVPSPRKRFVAQERLFLSFSFSKLLMRHILKGRPSIYCNLVDKQTKQADLRGTKIYLRGHFLCLNLVIKG